MPAAIPFVAAAFLAVGSVATAIGALSAVAFTVAGFAVTWAAVATIAGVALMAVSMLTMKTPKMDSSGAQLQTKLDARAPVPIAFGRTATGGTLVYRQAWGNKNEYAGLATVLSAGGPIESIDLRYASEYLLSHDGNPVSGAATVSATTPSANKLFAGKMHDRYLLGDTPAAQTISDAMGGFGPFPSAPGKISGLAVVITRYDYSTDAFPQGMPSSLYVLKGVKLYDPRKDSTYPGGSGSHRLADATTWQFSENPYLAALHWTLGKFENGVKVYGIGARWGEIDVASFMHGANVADANSWKIGGVVTTGDDKFAVLSTILQSGAGVAIARGAQISCFVNAPMTSVLTISADDVIGQVEIQNTTSLRDRHNAVIPSYREPNQFWAIIEGDLVSSSVYQAEDNGHPKTMAIEYSLVQQAAQAHQLAAYELANSREFLTFTVAGKTRLLNARIGEAITVNIPEIAAENIKCLVVNREFNPSDLTVTLSLKTESDAKHAYALGQSQTAPPSITLAHFDQSNPDAPGGDAWSVTGTAITDNGHSVPAIVITGANDNPYTREIIAEYRVTGSTDWLTATALSRDATKIEITSVTSGTSYEVAISYRTVVNALSARLVLGPVTAGTAALDWAAVGNGAGTRPANNATVGAPSGTYVAGTLAETVVGHLSTAVADIATLQADFDALDASGVAAEIDAARDATLAARDATLTAETNAASSASSAAGSASSAGSSATTATTKASDAATSATAANTAKIAAESARDTAITNSTAAAGSAVSAGASATAALSYATLSSQFAGGSLVKNPNFAAWTTSTSPPDQWAYWSGPYTLARVNSTVNGLYALDLTNSAGPDAGLKTDGTLSPALAGLRHGWYVIEADVEMISGTSWVGAGVIVQGLNSSGAYQSEQDLDFANDYDVSGSVAGTTSGTIYRWRKLVNMDSPGITQLVLLLINASSLFPGSPTAKHLRWYHCSVRPASSAEIDGNKALADSATALANISTESTTRAAETSSLASRSTALEATVNNSTTGVVANTARIAAEESARASADGALATRATTLESRTLSNVANHVVNGSFTDGVRGWQQYAGSWGAFNSGWVGRYVNCTTTGAAQIYQDFQADAGFNYFVSAEGESDGSAYLVLEAINSGGTSLGYGPSLTLNGTGWARVGSAGYVAPTGTTTMRVHVVKDSGGTYINATRIAVQINAWTVWRDDATVADIHSRITTEEATRTTETGALATRATALEATVNNGTTGVAASAARIATEESARASGDSALATRATALESTVNNGSTGVAAIYAGLVSEEGTRASADSALATRASALEATVNNGSTGVAATYARVVSEESVRASGDSALATRATALEATVNNGSTGVAANTARIATEETARASGDSALASSISTVSSSLGSVTSRVTTAEGAITSLNGKTTAYWTTTAVAGSGRAELSIHADANGGGGVDIVGDVSIHGDLVVDGTVTTSKLADNSVLSRYSATIGSAVVGDGTLLNALSYNIVITSAADVILIATGSQNYFSSIPDWECHIFVNGSDTGAGASGAASVYVSSWALSTKVSLSAGTHNVALMWKGGTSGVHLTAAGLIADGSYK